MLGKLIISKKLFTIIIVSVLVIVSFIFRSSSLTKPLVGDFHDFRQAQTAITIQDYFNHGFSILNYKTPVFGPPWQIPLEFPIYQISVFGFMKLFQMTNIDLACRLVSTIYFYLSAMALLLLTKKYFKDEKIYLSIFLYYIFSPFNLVWSRAAFPDYASVFFGIMYILFFIIGFIIQIQKSILNI